MDWSLIVLAGIAGGFGGAIGFLMSNLFKSKTLKTIVFIVPAILCTQLAKIEPVKKFYKETVITSVPVLKALFHKKELTPFESLATKIFDNIKNSGDAEVKAYFTSKSNQEISTSIQAMTSRGLQRLGREDLILWNNLRGILISKDKKVCAGLWTGKLESQNIIDALNKFSPKELEQWYHITTTSIEYEVKQTPFQAPSDEVAGLGLTAIEEALGEEDSQRYAKGLENAETIDADEACYMMTKTIEGAKTLDEKIQEPFIRHLTSM